MAKYLVILVALIVTLSACKARDDSDLLELSFKDRIDKLKWIPCPEPLPEDILKTPKGPPKDQTPEYLSLIAQQAGYVFQRIDGQHNSQYNCNYCHGGGDIFALSTVLNPVDTAERIHNIDPYPDGNMVISQRMADDFLESIERMPPYVQGSDEPQAQGLSLAEKEILGQWIKSGAPLCRGWQPRLSDE